MTELSYVHPAIAVLAMLLALFVLNDGLDLRKRRVRGAATRPETRRRHIRFARPAIIVAAVACTLGPLSAVLLRGWKPLNTVHGWAGLLATAIFLVVAQIGQRLARGNGKPRGALHGWLGLLAVAVALLAAITGIELLP